MKTNIYYFSGTGNSLWAAHYIARKTTGELLPIASFLDQDTVLADADSIGIIFPVYYEDLPAVVMHFAQKLRFPENCYIFSVCTFGGAAGGSLRSLKRILKAQGGRLSAGFGVRMPQNAFLKRSVKYARLYEQSEKRLNAAAGKICSKKHGFFYPNPLVEAAIFPLQPVIISACKKEFIKLSGASAQHSMEELLHLTDKSFSVNADCIKCGICAGVCPVQNIRLDTGGPVWLHRCETCLACVNWCPRHAIQGGVSQSGYFYRHPEIEIDNIMMQHAK
jgi:Pyruvate/2-oxoacid:ferredoxin oxidoreductase delta subunit/flavodoxin